jgi:glycosyltransferase involved in cell wall biosynthesis
VTAPVGGVTNADAAAPLVSIVIPCFNYAAYVAGAIEGALAQTYQRTEVIVVNDGSTDNSLEVIRRYADRVLVVDKPNGGSITAYNRGFAASRGDIVILLDADDLIAPEAVAEVVRAWRPGVSKAQWDLAIIDGRGEDLGRRFCWFQPEYDLAAVRASFARTGTYRWPVTAGNAYARAFAEVVFPLQIDHGPDGTLNTIAPLYGEIVTIPRVLGSYRLHGGNQWASRGSHVQRLPERIAFRRGEIATLREHAARRGMAVPAGDVLDHELPFLNYRMAALKMGMDYPGRATDSVTRLIACAARALRAEMLSPRAKAAHFAWFLALGLAPRALAERLLWLRFHRALVRRAGRRLLGWLGRTAEAS